MFHCIDNINLFLSLKAWMGLTQTLFIVLLYLRIEFHLDIVLSFLKRHIHFPIVGIETVNTK